MGKHFLEEKGNENAQIQWGLRHGRCREVGSGGFGNKPR